MGWSLDEALRFPLRGGGYRGSKGERGVSSETQDGIPLTWRLNYVRLVCMFDYKKIRLANDHNHIHPQWAAHSLSQSLTGFSHLPDQIPSNSRIQHNIVRDRDQRQSLLQLLKLFFTENCRPLEASEAHRQQSKKERGLNVWARLSCAAVLQYVQKTAEDRQWKWIITSSSICNFFTWK